MSGDDVAELDAELDASMKTCPLFNDRQLDFCYRCDIDVPDGYLDNPTFDVMAGKCLKVIDAALEELENVQTSPDATDTKASEMIFKLDKLINNRFRLSDLNKQTVDLVMGRFVALETKFGAKRSKLCVEIGNLYFGLKYYQRAIEWYDIASKANAENKDAWNNKGVTLVRMGKAEASLQFYDLAIRLDPSYEQAWFNKGKALYKLRRIREAVACFDRAAQINPESITAWNNKGVLLRLLGKNREAIACYDNALRLRPDYEWAWHNKGMVLADMKKYPEAVDCFNKALSINPNFKPSIDAKITFDKKSRRGGFFKSRKKKEMDAQAVAD
jgi:tetratricopeptide (TPR) repeat protein